MRGKNLAVAVVFVVVIVAAFVVIARRTGLVGGKPQPPPAVLGQKIKRIEMKPPFKVEELSLGEWQKLGPDEAGRFKDPETKVYTMVDLISCASCVQPIPAAQYPPEILAMPRDTQDHADKQEEAKVNFRNAYKCPKCGKLAYPHEKY